MRIKVKTLLVTGAVLAAAGLTATTAVFVSGSDEGPRPVSAAEAQRMAVTRFRMYRASPSAVTVRVTTSAGTTVIRAVVDHRRHRAVGAYEAGGEAARGLLAWDMSGVAVARGGAAGAVRPGESRRPAPGAEASVPAVLRSVRAVPAGEWTRRGFAAGPLDAGLRLVLGLAADRPDNAQLLAQSGPSRLRGDRIDGRALDVFSGPRPRPQGSARPAGRSPLAYWIDADGDLRRVTATLGTGRTVTVDVTAGHVTTGKLPDGPWKPRRR
ncbi:hypothetical protein [Streptomyces aquilus]|uniref:hypothetical protein n=1 Tax=Streptomyces aquilus TaxID=2548456 RepID=UPI0036B60008